MRRLLVTAGAVVAVAVSVGVAGCGAATAPTTIEGAKVSAAEVLKDSAKKAEDINTYSADLVVGFSESGNTGKVQGKVRYQKSPQLAMDVNLSQVSFGAQNMPGGVRVILEGDTAYVKLDMLKTLVGATKPWVKLDLRQLGSQSGVDVDQFLGQARQFDLKTSTALLTASKDVKAVGTETVAGVETTHYAGTFNLQEAAALLAPEAQEQFKTGMAGVKEVKFDAWVDAEGLPRKIGLAGGTAPDTFNATLAFKGFNEPVSIEAPPATQVGELPANLNTGN
jgi:hypothetical protein